MFDDDFDPMMDDNFMEYGLMLMEDLTPDEAWAAYSRGEIDWNTLNTLLANWNAPVKKEEPTAGQTALGVLIFIVFIFFAILSAM